TRGDKVIAFKKRRRKNSRRKRGYRHDFSLIRITEILTEGAKPSQTPPPRPRREARKVEAEDTAAAEGSDGEAEAPAKARTAKKPATKKPAARKPAAKGKAAAKGTKSKKK